MTHGHSAYHGKHRCRCAVCRAGNAAYVKAYQDKHRALGLCVGCTAPALPGHVRCEKHNSRERARSIIRMRRYREQKRRLVTPVRRQG